MTAAKHTVGPWELIAGLDVFSGTCKIATCAITNNGIPADMDKANARLIAAAPDLLMALRSLLNWSPESGISKENRRARELARAVIAKTEGI